MSSSIFLFDDREFLFFGEVCSDVELVDDQSCLMDALRKSHSKPSKLALKIFFTGFAVAVSLLLSVSFETPLNLPSFRSAVGRVSSFATDMGIDRRLAKEFSQARQFLGLSQAEAAQVTGVAKSTVEKIDQGIYLSIGDQVASQLKPLVELYTLMKSVFGEKKFIARARLNTPDSFLGGVSPMDYSKENGLEGLKEVIALERKSIG